MSISFTTIMQLIEKAPKVLKAGKELRDFCSLHLNASKYKELAEAAEAVKQPVNSPAEAFDTSILRRKSVAKYQMVELETGDEQIICQLFKYERPLSVPQMSELFGTEEKIIMRHLDILLKNNFIDIYSPPRSSNRDIINNLGEPTKYVITHEGITYVQNIENV